MWLLGLGSLCPLGGLWTLGRKPTCAPQSQATRTEQLCSRVLAGADTPSCLPLFSAAFWTPASVHL